MWALLSCAEVVVGTPRAPAEGFARDLLVSPSVEGVQWVDARSAGDWALGHVPGAISLPPGDQVGPGAEEAWGPEDPAAVAALLAERGLRADVPVAVYGQGAGGAGEDGLAYWTLRRLGVADVRVLDGGLDTWLLAGGELSTEASVAGDFALGDLAPVLATTEEVRAASETGAPVLLDVRTEGEWDDGHIYGALHLPFDELLDEGFVRPPDDLRARLADAGVADPEGQVVTYCLHGQRAAHTFFVLELLGSELARDYVGSWTAWEVR